jgi:hypothetical protein
MTDDDDDPVEARKVSSKHAGFLVGEAINTLAEIMRSPTSNSAARVEAAKAIIEASITLSGERRGGT